MGARTGTVGKTAGERPGGQSGHPLLRYRRCNCAPERRPAGLRAVPAPERIDEIPQVLGTRDETLERPRQDLERGNRTLPRPLLGTLPPPTAQWRNPGVPDPYQSRLGQAAHRHHPASFLRQRRNLDDAQSGDAFRRRHLAGRPQIGGHAAPAGRKHGPLHLTDACGRPAARREDHSGRLRIRPAGALA